MWADHCLCHASHPAPLQAEGCNVIEVTENSIVLDRTPFYPQGGGQPSDLGLLVKGDLKSDVLKVTRDGDRILHLIKESNIFFTGDRVDCRVDEAKRWLHCVLHSGGHLIDAVVARLSWPLLPGRAYHFPDGPYVEYTTTEDDKTTFDEAEANDALKDLINMDLPITLLFKNVEDVPEAIRATLPSKITEQVRLIEIEGFPPVPCGGTHCLHTGQLQGIHIKRIKRAGPRVRVSYALK